MVEEKYHRRNQNQKTWSCENHNSLSRNFVNMKNSYLVRIKKIKLEGMNHKHIDN